MQPEGGFYCGGHLAGVFGFCSVGWGDWGLAQHVWGCLCPRSDSGCWHGQFKLPVSFRSVIETCFAMLCLYHGGVFGCWYVQLNMYVWFCLFTGAMLCHALPSSQACSVLAGMFTCAKLLVTLLSLLMLVHWSHALPCYVMFESPHESQDVIPGFRVCLVWPSMTYCALWWAALSTACNAISCHAVSCPAMPRYAMLCHAMPRYAMLCHAMPRYAMLCHTVPCYILLCPATLCHAMPCYVLLCHPMPAKSCWSHAMFPDAASKHSDCLPLLNLCIDVVLEQVWMYLLMIQCPSV